jgi:hypothetical protein
MGARQDLAAGISAGLSTPRVTVYDYPADLIKAPAVVIVPSEPYIQPSTYGRHRFNLDIQIVVPRTKMQNQLTALENLIADVQSAIATATVSRRFQWVEVGKPVGIEIGGVEYLQSTMLVTTALEAP